MRDMQTGLNSCCRSSIQYDATVAKEDSLPTLAYTVFSAVSM